MTSSRGLHAATIARAAAPILLVLGAMAVPAAAGPATLVLAVGAAVAIERAAPVAWAWAAMVPAAALSATREFSGVVPVAAGAACDAFGSPRVTWAIVEALVVLGAFTALAIALRTRRASVGLRMPAKKAVRQAAAGFGVLAIGSVVAVSVIGRSVPGPGVDGDPSLAAFVAAVIVGAAAIALAEELAFRGVLQHWLARTMGEWPAIVVQAVAYGVWVSSAGWGPAFGIAATVAGFVAGVLTARTGSLLVAWAWHAGIAVGLLAAMLCG